MSTWSFKKVEFFLQNKSAAAQILFSFLWSISELTVICIIKVWMLLRSLTCTSSPPLIRPQAGNKGKVINEPPELNVLRDSSWFHFCNEIHRLLWSDRCVWKWKCGFIWMDSCFQLSISMATLRQVEEKSFPLRAVFIHSFQKVYLTLTCDPLYYWLLFKDYLFCIFLTSLFLISPLSHCQHITKRPKPNDGLLSYH